MADNMITILLLYPAAFAAGVLMGFIAGYIFNCNDD
jgi:hypothetical protein